MRERNSNATSAEAGVYLVVHERTAYFRPHRHRGKTESTQVIEYRVDVVVFPDDGDVARVIDIGDCGSGRTFYYRMSAPLFYTLVIRNDVLVFHETTDGTSDQKDTVVAPWALTAESLFDRAA